MDDCAAVYEWMKGGIKLIYSLIDGVAVNSQHTGPPSPDSIRIQEAGRRRPEPEYTKNAIVKNTKQDQTA